MAGSPHLGYSLALDPTTGKPVGPPALLGSPAGDYLLVAWEAETANGRRIVVTHRLDCINPQ